jgi:hypothetical protein
MFKLQNIYYRVLNELITPIGSRGSISAQSACASRFKRENGHGSGLRWGDPIVELIAQQVMWRSCSGCVVPLRSRSKKRVAPITRLRLQSSRTRRCSLFCGLCGAQAAQIEGAPLISGDGCVSLAVRNFFDAALECRSPVAAEARRRIGGLYAIDHPGLPMWVCFITILTRNDKLPEEAQIGTLGATLAQGCTQMLQASVSILTA